MTSRQDSTAIGILASTVSVHQTLDKFARKKKKKKEEEVGNVNWNTPIQYELVADIYFGIDWESSSQ